MFSRITAIVFLISNTSINFQKVEAFNIQDYTHYLDYIPYRREGLAGFNDFRTARAPPTELSNRKMEIGSLKLDIEEVLLKPHWPTKWPYGFEDFRPLDYTQDEPSNTGVQYEFSQSLIEADAVTLIPGILRLPIKRHYVFPKDKFALSEHIEQYFFKDAKVLELFACYESILPEKYKLGPTIGYKFVCTSTCQR